MQLILIPSERFEECCFNCYSLLQEKRYLIVSEIELVSGVVFMKSFFLKNVRRSILHLGEFEIIR